VKPFEAEDRLARCRPASAGSGSAGRAPIGRGALLSAIAHFAVLSAAFFAAHLSLRAAPSLPVQIPLVMQDNPDTGTAAATPPTPAPAPPKPAPGKLAPPLPISPNAEARPPPTPPVRTAAAHPTIRNDRVSGAIGHGKPVGPHIVAAAPDAAINPPPAYPAALQHEGAQGTVILAITVLPDGSAGTVRIVRSSGYPGLDEAARSAVEAWHFLPALRDGKPVSSVLPFEITFQL
jgi:periplasmic protein TonB